MARTARAVAPGMPHHVAQRGNRRQQTFFDDEDYRSCLELMAQRREKYKAEIRAYCLTPDHVRLIAVPEARDGLKPAIGEAHGRRTRRIDFREGWRGRLRQGRFSSFMMDERYPLACARYVESNPVRAGLAEKPEDWRWSGAGPHIKGEDDIPVAVEPLLAIAKKRWSDFLKTDARGSEIKSFERHERTGRPSGSDSFIDTMERLLNRKLKPRKPGPKKKDK